MTTARTDWEERIGRASGTTGVRAPLLDPPERVTAAPGRGQVTLTWTEVPGAVGYLVHVAPTEHGPWEPLDHQGGDVLAVPRGPYADTLAGGSGPVWYAVAALSDVDVVGPLSSPVRSGATDDVPDAGRVAVTVRADGDAGWLERPWRPMVGSEHLSFLLSEETVGGQPIGSDLREALRLARETWGVESVRAHAILCDDLGVYQEVDGRPVHDFSRVDEVYDVLVDLGLRPVVELSFMPRDLAADPGTTVFEYGAVISPPKDWDRWEALVRDLAAHLVDRYGFEEVRDRWSFEVWNEANLEVFWSGTPEEFWRLYDVTARAVTSVHPDLRVGGPSSAAAGWVEQMLDHVSGSGARVDFVSTHTYGSPPLDVRPALERHRREGTPIWWTEWGMSPTHFDEASDGVLSAAFVLRGMRSAMGRIEALSYWVVSDHFEELGRPQKLFHGGFGLLTVGNLRKPRFWALALLDRLGDTVLPVESRGDGADSLVETLAARHEDGRVGVLLWNGTIDQTKALGSAELRRDVQVRVEGLAAKEYRLHHHRVDAEHSDVSTVWRRISGGADWPDESQWAELRAADGLAESEPPRDVATPEGVVVLDVDLPMPAISWLELVPVR